MWKQLAKFSPNPLSGYCPESVDVWVLKHSGLILDNLFYRKIKVAETEFRRVEIDYDTKGLFTEIRVFERQW